METSLHSKDPNLVSRERKCCPKYESQRDPKSLCSTVTTFTRSFWLGIKKKKLSLFFLPVCLLWRKPNHEVYIKSTHASFNFHIYYLFQRNIQSAYINIPILFVYASVSTLKEKLFYYTHCAVITSWCPFIYLSVLLVVSYPTPVLILITFVYKMKSSFPTFYSFVL